MLKASDCVRNNLSGNFEMREGAFRSSAVIFLMKTVFGSMCKETVFGSMCKFLVCSNQCNSS